mmetsp:Transcript_4293/g.7531  ORF Transcript_4293/g.7531 Transcript_4293/m.7531 type:complete len:94 (+) Transcript_4293:323-604(+)
MCNPARIWVLAWFLRTTALVFQSSEPMRDKISEHPTHPRVLVFDNAVSSNVSSRKRRRLLFQALSGKQQPCLTPVLLALAFAAWCRHQGLTPT